MAISNDDLKAGLEDVIEKTKSAAESFSKNGSKQLSLSKKRIEYMDAKSKISKAYTKFGQYVYEKEIGLDVDEDDLKVVFTQIKAYRERINVLEDELNSAKEEVKSDVSDIMKSFATVSEPIKKQTEEVIKNAKEAFKISKDKPEATDDEDIEIEYDEFYEIDEDEVTDTSINSNETSESISNDEDRTSE